MTITLTEDLEQDLARRAELLGVSPEELARRVIRSYLRADPELEAELRNWQRMTWHAWGVVE